MNTIFKQLLLVTVLGWSICVSSAQRLTPIGIAVTQMPRAALTNSSGGGGGGGVAFITSQGLGSLRSDFPAGVGFKFTANSTITITQLGRWVVAGNNQTHQLDLYDISASDTVPAASVTVNCSGATSGQYLYGTLSSSITLVSGHVYAVLSNESVGGDQWYNDNTTVSFTAAGTVNGSVFYAGSVSPSTSGNFSFVPVNFIYTP